MTISGVLSEALGEHRRRTLASLQFFVRLARGLPGFFAQPARHEGCCLVASLVGRGNVHRERPTTHIEPFVRLFDGNEGGVPGTLQFMVLPNAVLWGWLTLGMLVLAVIAVAVAVSGRVRRSQPVAHLHRYLAQPAAIRIGQIGRALLGKEVGDVCRVQSPGGQKNLEILKFTTIHEVVD